jgi:ornithine carbamoyltransferase
MVIKHRNLLTLADYTKEEILEIINKAKELKNKITPTLANKTIGLLFQKPSTRTRVSFEVAINQLKGNSLFLNWNDLQLGRKEPIKDTIMVLSRYISGLVARLFSHSDLEEIANYSDIPIINGLTDLYHPCQILGDLLTIIEKRGDLHKQKITFVGDSNNVSNSLLIASAILGLNTSLIVPKGYEPTDIVKNKIESLNKKRGANIFITNDLEEIKNSTVIYTDVWVSMGQEKEEKQRIEDFKFYQINEKLVKKAAHDYIFLHCLPRTPLEVTDKIFYGNNSVVWAQAENRLHAQKALLHLIFQ